MTNAPDRSTSDLVSNEIDNAVLIRLEKSHLKMVDGKQSVKFQKCNTALVVLDSLPIIRGLVLA